jgi:hypothetical protein
LRCQLRAERLFFFIVTVSFEAQGQTSGLQRTVGRLESYLNMAGAQTASDFRPLNQRERNDLYFKSLINPWGFAKAAMSAGLDQWEDKPQEWKQGWGAYGQRFANIEGQYVTQKTVTHLISSALREDNRYFGSGEHELWVRIRYAMASSVMARHDDGKLSPSISQIGGVAAGAFAARLWLPSSQNSASDAAISFGITMAGNTATSVVKEFLPDLLHRPGRKKSAGVP